METQEPSRRAHYASARLEATIAWTLVVVGILAAGLPAVRAGSGATFSGTGLLLVVGRTSSGAVVHMSMSGVPFSVDITSSSLQFNVMGMVMGGPLATGRISIGSVSATGGGTLGGEMSSQMGFTASSTGGEFECLMAGFSAGFSLTMEGMDLTIVQMDVHGAVAPGSYQAS